MSKMILNGKQYLNGTENFYDCKGVFIDTDTVIVDKTTFTSSLSYTASQDCYIRLYLVTQQGQVINILIDGEDAGLVYFAGTMGMPVFYYLKKGQTIAISNANSSTSSSYIVYGVQQGSTVSIQPVIYSETEREIGVWTDGKPLYQKTWVLDSPLSCATNTWVDTPIPNTGMQRIVKGFANDDYDNGGVNQSNAFMYLSFAVNAPTYVRVLNARNATITITHITLQYTKTTDTAGSGIYTPSGALAVHYSTNEQVIGTWIDNKPLYQKTIEVTNPTHGAWTQIISDNNINIIGYKNEASYAITQAGEKFSIDFCVNSNLYGRSLIYNNEHSMQIEYYNSYGTLSKYIVTIQYTKTTD
jgi:hypothetical protein